MTELSTDEAAVVQRFEAAADAEESLRMTIGLAIWDEGGWCGECDHRDFDDCLGCREDCGRYADVAIAVMRGDS